MRHGKSPTIPKERYTGDQLNLDPITPRSAVRELDNVIANLGLLPQRVNSAKKATIGARQRDSAKGPPPDEAYPTMTFYCPQSEGRLTKANPYAIEPEDFEMRVEQPKCNKSFRTLSITMPMALALPLRRDKSHSALTQWLRQGLD
jgi:hypothetical protein